MSEGRLDVILADARTASRQLLSADRNAGLKAIARNLLTDSDAILAANAEDVAAEQERGTPAALIDRLTLGVQRLEAMAAAVEQVADLPDPVNRVLGGKRLANGLELSQVTVPFGVIGMIYESRPNVTVDAATLVIKAGSAAVLRGSSNALNSNRQLVASMRRALEQAGLPQDAVQLIDSPDRELVTELLTARGKVDLVVPRGGSSLISHVVETAKVPVIETGVGNCHIFVDASADLELAADIVHNAKVQRPGVCNAVETLLVHSDVAEQLLPALGPRLQADGVELRADERAAAYLPASVAASPEDWDTEFLDLILAVKVVDSPIEAIEHIARHGSGHSDAILTRDLAGARRFQQQVDSAAVYVNASTRFTDGFEFGFGAELGISTQKLHARGPMGLEALVTSKYLIDGDGHIRP